MGPLIGLSLTLQQTEEIVRGDQSWALNCTQLHTRVAEQTLEFNGLEWEWLPHLNPKRRFSCCFPLLYFKHAAILGEERPLIKLYYKTTQNFLKLLLSRGICGRKRGHQVSIERLESIRKKKLNSPIPIFLIGRWVSRMWLRSSALITDDIASSLRAIANGT